MASQTQNGKAYECVVAEALSRITGFGIAVTPEYHKAKNYLETLDGDQVVRFERTASEAAKIIYRQESLSLLKTGDIRLQPDSKGQRGDVRDIVIAVPSREIGISCKTNHADLKHSRLSQRLDFVRSWGICESGCSDIYWSEIRPIFESLAEIRSKSCRTAEWKELPDVAGSVYWPLLEAWRKELVRALGNPGTESSRRCASLARYLFGNRDFFKVVGRHGKRTFVSVQGFNFGGTLNIPKSKLPSK